MIVGLDPGVTAQIKIGKNLTPDFFHAEVGQREYDRRKKGGRSAISQIWHLPLEKKRHKSKASSSGLPDFSWCNVPKLKIIYQMTQKYTKCQQNVTNNRKRDQMAQKLPTFSLQDHPKFTQIGIYG
jgi:hypothetical protein